MKPIPPVVRWLSLASAACAAVASSTTLAWSGSFLQPALGLGPSARAALFTADDSRAGHRSQCCELDSHVQDSEQGGKKGTHWWGFSSLCVIRIAHVERAQGATQLVVSRSTQRQRPKSGARASRALRRAATTSSSKNWRWRSHARSGRPTSERRQPVSERMPMVGEEACCPLKQLAGHRFGHRATRVFSLPGPVVKRPSATARPPKAAWSKTRIACSGRRLAVGPESSRRDEERSIADLWMQEMHCRCRNIAVRAPSLLASSRADRPSGTHSPSCRGVSSFASVFFAQLDACI
jgi:hypothetical protein